MKNGTRFGLGVSDKAPVDCDVGLGLKMVAQPPPPRYPQGGFGDGGVGGPAAAETSEVVFPTTSSPPLPRSFHSFRSTTNSAFKSPGILSATVKASFTVAQFQELERQMVVYKHLLASVPIPPELLISISSDRSEFAPSLSSAVRGALELGFAANGSDPEPWRCRRTDGKKWRCSRDVAPDQKYCERHAHKNRPRSRKPVELNSHLPNAAATTTTTTKAYSKPPFHHAHDQILPFSTLTSSASYEHPRSSDWFNKAQSVATTTSNNQHWQQLIQFGIEGKRENTNYSRDPFGFNQQEPVLGSHFCTSFGTVEDPCSLLLGPKLSNLEAPRDFIDAWSAAERERDQIGGKSKCWKYEAHERSQVGPSGERSQPSASWVNGDSWLSSPPGGPLAEALCLGIATVAKASSSEASPNGCSTASSCSKSGSGDSRN